MSIMGYSSSQMNWNTLPPGAPAAMLLQNEGDEHEIDMADRCADTVRRVAAAS
jgi:hypothetical protein